MQRLKLISCEIFYREFCKVVADSVNIIDLDFSTQGLHDLDSNDMRMRLQEIIDSVDSVLYKAILLGFGLCNNGISGLIAKKIPLIVPRAHDCITFFLGSKEKYKEYFDKNPGTYYKTTGWMERCTDMETWQSSKKHKLGLDKTYEEYVKMYGEENAKFIMETIEKGTEKYTKYSYIDMDLAKSLKYDEQTKEDANKKSWEFENLKGDFNIFRKLVDGEWNKEDFLIVNPGQKISVTYSDDIIKAENI